MLIEYDDGSTVATCSLHCVAVDMANNIDKAPKTIKVADFNSKKIPDAEKAEAFVKVNGGKLADFDEAIKTAYEDMYKDTKMIRDKRKIRKLKMDGLARQYNWRTVHRVLGVPHCLHLSA